ncbi:hybrid sensor histidine kinase/response regulator [Pedobacter sp. R20-19]|uniref:hybrid sensor histidine kinase/response regulator n=1 Tax=Pedobacter sp. R20-19 TaxID=1270196 RepID=UPI00068B2643|nr:hybrid sensor histidine kinase/response regulator [Pedobacter sp. R20-19]
MENNFLSLSLAQLNRLFPCFLLIDSNSNIIQMGEVLKVQCGDCIGGRFSDHFERFNQEVAGNDTKISSKDINGWVTGKWEEFDNGNSFLFAGEKFLLNNSQEMITADPAIQKSSDIKELFLVNISHEIRTPMNAIISMTGQLSKTMLTDEQDYFIQTIQTASKNLLLIFDDILDLSKIDAGKLDLKHVGFNLPQVFSEAMELMINQAEKKGLEIDYILPNEINIAPVLMGDPHRINQVIMNLLSNAIKFTEKGSVSLTAFVLKDDDNSQEIEILVRDSGIGMEPEFVNRIFDNFSQEHESLTRQYSGIGLGLSISQKLVAQMGGHFKVESKKGIGSAISFVIKLPKGTDKNLVKEVKSNYNEDLFAGRKILIVDDNETNRLVASTILLSYGSQVLNAEHGEMALEMVKESAYDIILMDIQMPVLDGYETTRILRQRGYPGTIIALTASVVSGERERCIAAGMDDYLTKPINEEILVDVIDSWMKKIQIHISEPMLIEPLYSLDGLRIISKGREDFVTKMIELFCVQVPEALNNLNASFRENDLPQVSKLAHKLKSTIDHLEIKSIRSTIRNIEELSENVSRAELILMIDEVNHVLNQVLDELQLEIKERCQ